MLRPVQDRLKKAFGLWGPMVDASPGFKWEELGLTSLEPKIETMQKIAVSTMENIMTEIKDTKAKAESVSNEFNVFLSEDDWNLDKFKLDVKSKEDGAEGRFSQLRECSLVANYRRGKS